MKYSSVFIIFAVTLLVREAKGRLTLEPFLRAISTLNPALHRVRHIEDAKGDPYAVLDTVGLAETYGFPAEQHNLTTEDGYNIVFFRVSGSPKSPPREGKPIVFVQHGLFSSSDTFLLLDREHSLVFVLADAGYDVWIGNTRGNSYCRSHTNLTVADKEFWDFSFHEMAVIDVPAMIDYVLKFCGADNLHFIGDSMGSTIAFVFLSEKPEYNAKMRAVFTLAPVTSWKYNPSIFLRLIVDIAPVLKQLGDSMDIHNVLPQMKLYSVVVEPLCSEGSLLEVLCLASVYISMSLSVGKPAKGFDPQGSMALLKYFPAGASIKSLMHYQQNIQSGDFRKYDNGPAENLEVYGTKTPPFYDMSKISAPLVLIYGSTDLLSVPENVIDLSKQLSNVVTCEAVPADAFNHLDFVISLSAKDLVYTRILELLSKY